MYLVLLERGVYGQDGGLENLKKAIEAMYMLGWGGATHLSGRTVQQTAVANDTLCCVSLQKKKRSTTNTNTNTIAEATLSSPSLPLPLLINHDHLYILPALFLT